MHEQTRKELANKKDAEEGRASQAACKIPSRNITLRARQTVTRKTTETQMMQSKTWHRVELQRLYQKTCTVLLFEDTPPCRA